MNVDVVPVRETFCDRLIRFKIAFFDRAEFLGDPDFSKIPVAQLVDKRYAAAWAESIDPGHAHSSKELKRPSFGNLDRDATLRLPKQYAREPRNTTHYSVVDPDGHAVAVTTTLNDSLGSRVTLEGLGFLLNDEMDDFASKQGIPNVYGLIQGPANAIASGKRPLSAMTPTMVLKDDKLFLVLGAEGGPTIISNVVAMIVSVIDHGLDIQEAVNAPRYHHQWMPDELELEDRISSDTIRLLRAKGHTIKQRHFWGDAECIMIDPKTGERLGAPDARGNGKAIGF